MYTFLSQLSCPLYTCYKIVVRGPWVVEVRVSVSDVLLVLFFEWSRILEKNKYTDLSKSHTIGMAADLGHHKAANKGALLRTQNYFVAKSVAANSLRLNRASH